MHYYGTRLSENMSRRPEGYLLCLNVPVARSGTQEYLAEELGMYGNGLIPVLRPEEEVFSPETMASFEGMPVTNDHPPDGVDAENIGTLGKGHAQNIRRGTGEESDLLLADLMITDPELIHAILDLGKREISCGYTYELCEEKGQFIQRKIRGNHVAVVDAGRAGHRVSIRDSKTERRKRKMKKSIVRKLVRMAKDGDPEAIEAIAELIEEAQELETGAAGEAAAPEEEEAAVTVGTPGGNVIAIDEEAIAGVIERLDRIIELLTPAGADEEAGADPVEEIVEAVSEAVEEAVTEAAAESTGALEDEEEEAVITTPEEVAEIVGEIMDPVLSEVLEPGKEDSGDECAETEEIVSKDALRIALKAIKPALVKMPRNKRMKAAADIAARMLKPAARKSADSRRPAMTAPRKKYRADSADLGKRIMNKRNPNYRNR